MEDSTPFLKMSRGCPCIRLHREPSQKTCKGRNILFLFALSKFSGVEAFRKESDSLQDRTRSSAALLSAADKPHQEPPWLYCFSGEILLRVHLLSYNTRTLCCDAAICAQVKRGNLFLREERCTVFSVRDWAINLSTTTDAFCLSVDIRKL